VLDPFLLRVSLFFFFFIFVVDPDLLFGLGFRGVRGFFFVVDPDLLSLSHFFFCFCFRGGCYGGWSKIHPRVVTGQKHIKHEQPIQNICICRRPTSHAGLIFYEEGCPYFDRTLLVGLRNYGRKRRPSLMEWAFLVQVAEEKAAIKAFLDRQFAFVNHTRHEKKSNKQVYTLHKTSKVVAHTWMRTFCAG